MYLHLCARFLFVKLYSSFFFCSRLNRTTMQKYQILAWRNWVHQVENHMLQPESWAHMVMLLLNMLQQVST